MTRSRRRSQDETLAPHSIDGGLDQGQDLSPPLEYGRQLAQPFSRMQHFPFITGPPPPEDSSESNVWELMRADQNPGAGKEETSSPTRLTKLALNFVNELRCEDFMRYQKFLNDNKELLRRQGTDQMCFDAAATAIEEEDLPRARSCVEMGILVSACKKMSESEQAHFFKSLSEGEKTTAKGFYQACRNREMEISDHVQSRRREAVPVTGEAPRLTNLTHVTSGAIDSDEVSDTSTIREMPKMNVSQRMTETTATVSSLDPQSSVPAMNILAPLSTLGQAFVDIPESKYDDCRAFLEQNSGHVDFNETQLIEEAERLLAAGDRRLARRSVQQSLLLKRWKSTPNPGRFFDALQREGSSEMVALLQDFDTVYLGLQNHAPTETSIGLAHRTSNTKSLSNLESLRPPANEQSSNRRSLGVPNGSQILQSRYYPNPGRESGPPPSQTRRPASRPAAPMPDPTHFDRNSQVRRSHFYTFGRVFALVWHEAAHSLDTDPTSSEDTARFGGPVFSYVRRMAVVKTGNGYCWCVPMSTYGGRGLSKPGMTPQDINDHAIIHMEAQTPRRLPSEPTTEKRPISVRPASRDQRFPPASRINFARVHTVEFSVKVIDVGTISDESLPDFRRYFREQLDIR